MWRRWGMVRQAKLNLLRFIRLSGTPDEIAKGFALGIFIGMTPTFGFQMLLAVFAAFLLRENRLAAIIGVWITNPVTAPFIYAAEYEFGRRLLQMDPLSFNIEFTFDSLMALSWDILLPLLLGSLVFGLLSTAISYAVVLRMIPSLKTLRVPRWPRHRSRS
ncbi:MAG: DUF2062 domain-containing protein [Desulfuromonas sp.]|nr:MAG: DUF2062 domain-containing protein [Desulfuromonas sp.]